MRKQRRGAILLLFLVLGLLLCLTPEAFADSKSAKWPKAGSADKKNGKLQIDATGTADGYFFASVKSKTNKKVKLRVVKDGQTLTYDLNGNGEFELFPLQLGDGKYEVSLYINVSGKKYATEGSVSLNVKLKNKHAPFLVPNQYVNYTKKSECVLYSDTLCAEQDEKKAYELVCNFMSTSFVYDYIKALNIKAGTLPDIDGSYKKHMGVCQDLSAIMVAMLRTQGIPSKLIIGYADRQYHAWVMTYIGKEEVFFDPTAALSAINPVKKYSMERYY